VVLVTSDVASVVTVGAVGSAVVVNDSTDPKPVPSEFSAIAQK
jgi:hypothetical protein